MSKRLVILGAGESGVGAAYLAKKLGYEIFVSDFGQIKSNYQQELNELNVAWESGTHTHTLILNADLVIKSPGIPETAAMVRQIKEAGIELISEIEFASRHTDKKIVAITGSNGKTTTTTLTHHILQNAGLNAALCGNVGKSFARCVAQDEYDFYVVEVSSFQLDDISTFKPNVAVLLNVTPDHLDRYGYEFKNYIKAKFNITKNQDENDHFIYNDDDLVVNFYKKQFNVKANQYAFSLSPLCGHCAAVKNNNHIQFKSVHTNWQMNIKDLSLAGNHNIYNSMASAITAYIMEVPKEAITKSLSSFANLEHRMEKVKHLKGVQYINDSKATNVNSTWYALEAIEGKVVWIVGGKDKGNDYEILKPLVQKKVDYLIALGADNQKIKKAFGDIVPNLYDTDSMAEAVRKAHEVALPGATVLLSPACASFDLFKNYEDRGQQFVAAVKKLA